MWSSPFGGLRDGADRYDSEERRSGSVVFVEVDDVKDLRDAYPNYFLDVREFTPDRAARRISPQRKP